MGTFQIEALADGIDIAAMVWRPITRTVAGHQGQTIGSASDYVFKTEMHTLNTGDEMDNIAHLGRVNSESNPAMPAQLNVPIVIGDVLRVTKTSDDKPSF
jgi:hypothetical protein